MRCYVAWFAQPSNTSASVASLFSGSSTPSRFNCHACAPLGPHQLIAPGRGLGEQVRRRRAAGVLHHLLGVTCGVPSAQASTRRCSTMISALPVTRQPGRLVGDGQQGGIPIRRDLEADGGAAHGRLVAVSVSDLQAREVHGRGGPIRRQNVFDGHHHIRAGKREGRHRRGQHDAGQGARAQPQSGVDSGGVPALTPHSLREWRSTTPQAINSPRVGSPDRHRWHTGIRRGDTASRQAQERAQATCSAPNRCPTDAAPSASISYIRKRFFSPRRPSEEANPLEGRDGTAARRFSSEKSR